MRVFRELELVEHLGSGVPRILEKYHREAFKIFPHFLRIIFGFERELEVTGGVTGVVAPQVTTPSRTPSHRPSHTPSHRPSHRKY